MGMKYYMSIKIDMNFSKKSLSYYSMHTCTTLTEKEYRNGTINKLFKQDIFTGEYLSTPTS